MRPVFGFIAILWGSLVLFHLMKFSQRRVVYSLLVASYPMMGVWYALREGHFISVGVASHAAVAHALIAGTVSAVSLYWGERRVIVGFFRRTFHWPRW